MADQSDSKNLWTPRSVAETQKIYADWADTYEDDVTRMAYATPARLATALAAQTTDFSAPVLDYGCGTGLSGVALRDAGFQFIDGTDISPEMLVHARDKDIYRTLTLGDPDVIGITKGKYSTIVATGVISLGAAPPDMLNILLDILPKDGTLAFSYNDPTLADASYVDALNAVVADKIAAITFREHGPHLNEKVTGSDVIILRRL